MPTPNTTELSPSFYPAGTRISSSLAMCVSDHQNRIHAINREDAVYTGHNGYRCRLDPNLRELNATLYGTNRYEDSGHTMVTPLGQTIRICNASQVTSGERYFYSEVRTCCSGRNCQSSEHYSKLQAWTEIGHLRWVCPKCSEGHLIPCPSCGKPALKGSLIQDEYEDSAELGCCQRCIYPRSDDDEDSDSVLNRYQWSEASRYKSETKDALRLGVELEVEVTGSLGNATKGTIDTFPDKYVALKTDGSLNFGFEIVTRPDSLEVHKRMWNKFFDARVRGLSSETAGTCGMHVHMSRAPLTPTTLGKMLVFINSNKTRTFMEKIAGRAHSSYSEMVHKKIGDLTRPGERYQALNLTNVHTVEFRLFKGTLKRSTFFKNLEFCQAIKEWADVTSIREAESVDSFSAFVQKYPKRFPHLGAFIKNPPPAPKPEDEDDDEDYDGGDCDGN